MNVRIASEPKDVWIETGTARLDGTLTTWPGAKKLVVFAHGSGSSRHSPRNRFVAEFLNARDFATLLFDLLTTEEEVLNDRSGELRFDVGLLARRLTAAVDFISGNDETKGASLGLFGASTGAAAALMAATARPERVGAVVSRGGRPDLARDALSRVAAPTLLIVGERDEPVIGLNQRAARELRVRHELALVPGATHLFEEPGALNEVAELAARWFGENLGTPASSANEA